jgi:hypothetical protein
MNELTEIFKAGALLGDIICQTTGHDIDIVRFEERFPQKAVEVDDMYNYTHSTVASFNSVAVGTARVYIHASNNDLQVLTRGRMKETLRKLGYRILISSFDLYTRILSRVIVSPAIGGGLAITETLFLDAIESVVFLALPYRSSGSATFSFSNYPFTNNLPFLGNELIRRVPF